jgi:hypothetical protein
MADILIDNQTAPTTPLTGKSVIWIDNTTKKLLQTDDGGAHHGCPVSKNFTTAAQGAIATTEVYITGSNILIPSYGMQAGMIFVWYISASKTAAGVAAPIWTFRVGPAGAVGDTSRLALTSGGAQVATAMDGILVAQIGVRSVGASGVIAGSGGAGPANFGGGGSGASAGFDNTATIAGQYIGLTVTTGTSAAWTINGCSCYLIN